MSIEKRMKDLGVMVPELTKPVAAYVPAVKTSNLIYTAGQLPLVEGELKYKGKVGRDYGVEEGYEAARICFLNCLAAIKDIVGDLDRIKQVVKINGFVNSTPDFTQQPQVINGASELCLEIFRERGKHARAALGSVSLPLGAAVELEMIVEVDE